MNEFQIFKELTELDDDLLPELREEEKHRSSLRRVLRLPLAAVLIGLLIVTTFAVTVRLSVRFSGRTAERSGFPLTQKIGYGLFLDEGGSTAEVRYALEPRRVREEAALTRALTGAWERWTFGHEHFTGAYLLDEAGARVRFDGISEAAEALGLSLTVSDALNAADGPCFVRLLIASAEAAALEYADRGTVSPAALVLEDALPIPGGESGLDVFVALQSELPPDFALRTVSFLRQEGEVRELSYQTAAGVELVILQTEGEEFSSCAVVWCRDGIGYLASLQGKRSGAPAQDKLMPLLTELAP